MSPRRPEVEKKQSGLPSWLVFTGIVAIAIVAVFVGADLLGKLQSTSQSTGPASVSAGGIVRSGRTEGDPTAAIELVEYSDFQ